MFLSIHLSITTHNTWSFHFCLYIVFYHYSRMFYCFVYLACTYRRLLSLLLVAGRLLVALACLLPLGTSICSLHIIVHPVMSHFLHHLVLGECHCSNLCFLAADTWSLSLICSSVADPTCPELLLAFTGTFTACYQLRLSLISTILQPFTPNNQFTSLIRHP